MYSRFSFAALAGLLLLFLGAAPARAITTIPRDFDQLVKRADLVFKGTVSSKTSEWTDEGLTRHIVTFVTFHVEETYKGAPAAEQTLRFLGGTVGSQTMDVPDMPAFETGQKAVLFVVGNGKQFCPLVGIAQGRFQVVKDETTGHERILPNDGSPVMRTADLGQTDAAGALVTGSHAGMGVQAAMAADDFRAEILNKVATLPR